MAQGAHFKLYYQKDKYISIIICIIISIWYIFLLTSETRKISSTFIVNSTKIYFYYSHLLKFYNKKTTTKNKMNRKMTETN